MKDVMNFDAAVIAAVTGHMNDDHPDDSLLIAKAFGYPEATASAMVGLDANSGVWRVKDAAGEHELRVGWPGAPITDRPGVRLQVVELYEAACAKLGLPAREAHQGAASAGHGLHAHGSHAHGSHGEQGENPHGAHGGGNPHGAHPHAGGADDAGPKPFSRVVRESSWSDHSSSEGASFMEDIMRGIASKQDYIDLVAQHFFTYEALEEAAQQLVADPAYAALHPEALVRLGTLEIDLEHLLGAGWRDEIRPVPATEAYAARIREVAAERWLPGIVAHHYTRYLGDLSGGQIIAKRVARQHGFEEAGIAFYDFASLGDLKAFKETYRDGLDSLGETLDADEQQRMVEEVRTAYAFNTAIFVDLTAQNSAA